jgi:acetyl-CoA acyltransferase 1
LNTVLNHVNPSNQETEFLPNLTAASTRSSDDVVIVCAVRTPIGKARRGNLKDTYPEELLATALKGIIEKTGINPKDVDDIAVGNVLPAGGGATVARMAMFYAGFPYTTSTHTVNRQCSSGLQACAQICSAIKSGYINIGIGAGVESMSLGYGANAMASGMSSLSEKFPDAADCLIPMGLTSENVATDFGVTREEQDKMAFESHQKAANAQTKGYFDSEIVPVHTTVQDKDGKEKKVVVSKDEGVRADTTLEGLTKLKPAFTSDGTTTAGNSSQVSDGAAAVLFMKRSTAQKLNLPVLARFVGFAVAGVPPRVMGIGPAFAIPKVLEQTGLKKEDIDVYEINEAFASQAVYCVKKLGLDFAKVNPNGGAIALGHPLGCTGSRQIATLLPELKRRKGRYGVISMCIGSGMGAAAVIESEQN